LEEQRTAGPARTQRAFAVSVFVSAAWLVTVPLLGGLKWLTLVVVLGCHLRLVLLERRFPSLSQRRLLLAVAGLVVLAVVLPPYGSKDVWSYAMYGRIVGHYRASPYAHSPAAFRGDPLYLRVNNLWRHTPSVYGPLFSAASGFGALGYRTSPLLARLYFQALAGLALLGSTALLLRRRVAPWIVCLIALAPATLVAVNAGHVDVLVALGILASLLLIIDHRFALGGLALALTLLVKIVALPVVVGVLLALLIARRWRPALLLSAVLTGVVGVGYALAGGLVALSPDRHGARYLSRASIVNGIHELYQYAHIGPWPLLRAAATRSALALLLAAAALLIFAWRHRHSPDVATFAVAATIIYLLTANYVLPWYALAMLPAAALVSERLRWYGYAVVVLLQFAYIHADRHHMPAPWLVAHIAPIPELVLLALVVFSSKPAPGSASQRGAARQGAEPIGEATQEHSGSFAQRSLAKSTSGAELATYPRRSKATSVADREPRCFTARWFGTANGSGGAPGRGGSARRSARGR